MSNEERPNVTDGNPVYVANSGSNGLTVYTGSIHWPATNQVEGQSELDEIDIDNFLRTLTEVAISIAAREAEAKDQDRND